MKTLRSLGLVLASGMVFGLGCQLISGANPDATFAENGGGGAGGMTVVAASSTASSSSGGGSGGSGGNPECTTVSDCIAGECKTPTACTNGVCVWKNEPNGTPTTSQLYGDCLDRVCDGQGGITSAQGDPTKDTYNWGNPCYLDACNAAANPMPNDGVMCTTPWGKPGICTNFKCHDCTIDAECGANKKCIISAINGNRCLLPTCFDMVKSPGETDIDCGGPDCLPCAAGMVCNANSDCEGTCDMTSTMQCLAPSCVDTVRNADETDVDCGGACAKQMPAKKCADFKKCLFPNDCASGVCKIGQCQEALCTDYVKNQDEDGIDCGGATCLSCPPPPKP